MKQDKTATELSDNEYRPDLSFAARRSGNSITPNDLCPHKED